MTKVALLLAISLTPITSARACDLCAVYNAIEREGGAAGTFNTGIAHRFAHYESNIRPAGLEGLRGQHLESNITQLFAQYNILDDLSAQLTVPFIFRDYQRAVEQRIERGSERGVGDLSVMFKYVPVRKHKPQSAFLFEIRGGLKLPSGDSDRLAEERAAVSGSLLRHSSVEGNLVGGDDLALGSGSYDFLLGTAAFYQSERFFLAADTQYVLRREGDFDYEYGNDFIWSVGPGYYLDLEDERTIALKLRLSGEHKERDSLIGQKIAGTSDDDLFLGSELVWTTGTSWHITIGADLPIRSGDSADEVTPRYRVWGSVSYKL